MRVAPWDDDEPYQLNLWVESTKSAEEFERVLGSVVEPLEIHDHTFRFGNVDCAIYTVAESQPPRFSDIPVAHYSFRIDVPAYPWDFWGWFNHIIPFAVAGGLRGKFSCRYLITAEPDFFVLFSGTNQPSYYNDLFPAFHTGELGFIAGSSDRWHRVSIPWKA